MTKWDMMKLAQKFDSEFSPGDFTGEELEKAAGAEKKVASPEEIRRRYFEFYDDVKDRTQKKHEWSV